MKIDFCNETDKPFDYLEEKFNYFANKVHDFLEIKKSCIFEVNIIDNEQIHSINRDYRNVDRPTDVISFAFDDNVEGETKINNPEFDFLGEIYISYERCSEQAKEIGNSFDKEMCFLFVHGLLHLLGYNHIEEKEAEIMYNIQREIFKGENI